jgi:inorganic pyrophosphatase
MNAKLAESHQHWRNLATGKEKRGDINVWQTTNPRFCKSYVKPEDATAKFNIPKKANILPPAARPAPYDRWYYLDGSFNLITVPGDVVEVD